MIFSVQLVLPCDTYCEMLYIINTLYRDTHIVLYIRDVMQWSGFVLQTHDHHLASTYHHKLLLHDPTIRTAVVEKHESTARGVQARDDRKSGGRRFTFTTTTEDIQITEDAQKKDLNGLDHAFRRDEAACRTSNRLARSHNLQLLSELTHSFIHAAHLLRVCVCV